jgi:hypothetical protein
VQKVDSQEIQLQPKKLDMSDESLVQKLSQDLPTQQVSLKQKTSLDLSELDAMLFELMPKARPVPKK